MRPRFTDQAAELRMLVAASEAGARARAVPAARVVAVASGKGGVGKTNIAVNLAMRLSQRGRRVVLVDADLGTANIDVVMNVRSAYDLSHVVRGQRTLDEIAVQVDARLRLIVGASGLASIAELSPSDRHALIEALGRLERQCDIIVLDCGAGISQNVLAFARAAEELLVVTTPEPTALTDAYALVKVLSRGGRTPPMGLVVNQTRTAVEGRNVAERLASTAARFLRIPVDCAALLPKDEHVSRAVHDRVPFVLKYPRCPAATGISALAARVVRQADGADCAPGFFRRVLGFFC
ncbi:MAG: MinD/ParA family protein [Phycisphaerae bacterium]